MAIIRKAFKDFDIKSGTTNTLLGLDKLALNAFDWLSHNRKVSRPLVASFFLDLPDHYFPTVVMKTINILLLKTKFDLTLSGQYLNQSDNIIRIYDRKVGPYLMYDDYIYRGPTFQKLSIYEYYQCVFFVKRLQQ